MLLEITIWYVSDPFRCALQIHICKSANRSKLYECGSLIHDTWCSFWYWLVFITIHTYVITTTKLWNLYECWLFMKCLQNVIYVTWRGWRSVRNESLCFFTYVLVLCFLFHKRRPRPFFRSKFVFEGDCYYKFVWSTSCDYVMDTYGFG